MRSLSTSGDEKKPLKRPLPELKEAEREVIGVVVVGHPAADQDVHLGALLRVQVIHHRGGDDIDLDAEVAPDAEEGRRQRAEAILKDRMNRGPEPDRERHAS